MKRAGEEKLSKVASTKLTIKDYELCQKIARDYYFKEITKMPSISELNVNVIRNKCGPQFNLLVNLLSVIIITLLLT
jgi:hypothetical protein